MLYVLVGETAAPGGQLFGLVVLIVAANFGGFLMSLTTLPRLIGMLATGILMQNLHIVNIGSELSSVTGYIRKFALVLILIRAGLEMDPAAFKNIVIFFQFLYLWRPYIFQLRCRFIKCCLKERISNFNNVQYIIILTFLNFFQVHHNFEARSGALDS